MAKIAQTLHLCMFATTLRKLMKFADQLCKSAKSLKRYACTCFGDFMEGSWSPQGVLRLVSLRTSHGKSPSNVTPVHVCYKVEQIEHIGWQIAQIAKVAQTLRLCMLWQFHGRLLESSGRPQAGFAQNVSLQKSLKRYACACFGDLHCDPLVNLTVSASSPKSLKRYACARLCDSRGRAEAAMIDIG